MAVSINSVARRDAAEKLLVAADQASGNPDKMTSIEEVKAFVERNPDFAKLVGADVAQILKDIEAQEGRHDAVRNTTPERQAQLADIAAGMLQRGEINYGTFEDLRNKGTYPPGEIDILADAIYPGNFRDAQFNQQLDAYSADGIITPDERKLIDAAAPNAEDGVKRQVAAQTRALMTRRLIGSLAIDNVLGGLTPARVGIDPPKVDVKVATKSITDRARDAAVAIATGSTYGNAKWDKAVRGSMFSCLEGGFYNKCFGKEQLDANAIADKILAQWSTKTGPNSISGERILQAVFFSESDHLSWQLRREIASKVAEKITPEQASTLSAATAAAIVNVIEGYRSADSNLWAVEKAVTPYALNRVPGVTSPTYQVYTYYQSDGIPGVARILKLTEKHLVWTRQTVTDR